MVGRYLENNISPGTQEWTEPQVGIIVDKCKALITLKVRSRSRHGARGATESLGLAPYLDTAPHTMLLLQGGSPLGSAVATPGALVLPATHTARTHSRADVRLMRHRFAPHSTPRTPWCARTRTPHARRRESVSRSCPSLACVPTPPAVHVRACTRSYNVLTRRARSSSRPTTPT